MTLIANNSCLTVCNKWKVPIKKIMKDDNLNNCLLAGILYDANDAGGYNVYSDTQ
jgi:hypothetical protein